MADSLASGSGSVPAPVHPYFPTDAVIPGFVPNDRTVDELIPIFGSIIGAVIVSALRQTLRSPRSVRSIDRFASAWFAMCGFLHMAFEGYYLYYRDSLPGMNTTFAQLWKEYAISDSRYLTGDVFTISIETITFFIWGPLCWYTFISIQKGSRSRHVVQTIASTAHLYGVALYYLTNWNEWSLNGVEYSRPEALYFWVYYVGFNLPWVVVPIVLLHDSWEQISSAFAALHEKEDREEEAKKEGGEEEEEVKKEEVKQQ